VSDSCRDSTPHTRVLVFNGEHDTEFFHNPPVGDNRACGDSSFVTDGCRTGRGRTSTIPHVFSTHSGIFFVGRQFQLGVSVRYCLLEHLFQERPTPATPGPRPKTVAQLPNPLGFFDPDEIQDLALCDVKTEAYLAIRIRHKSPPYPLQAANQRDTPGRID
jgi:hypothetical protein